jgi:uncharacterized membrane protein
MVVQTPQSIKGTSMENVLAVNFEEDSNAYEALSVLKQMDDQGQLALAGASVVVREQDGNLVTKDQLDDTYLEGTATGGIVGLVIGILGGPFGVLIGGATGLLVGSLFDLEDDDDTQSALSDISRSVRVDRTGLIADVNEQSPEVLDTAMARLGGTVVRRSLGEVQAEIAAAEDAQRAAAKEARKQLHEHRRDQAKEKVQAKIDELKAKIENLKAKLHGHPADAASK